MARKRRRNINSKKPRRRIPRFLAFILCLVLLIGAGAYISTLPIWQIKDVIVNGAGILSAEEVRALAGIPLNENLFFTDFSRAKSNLRKITAIREARFYRIPPASVLISITERKPIAAVVLQKKSVIIDEEGYILNRNPNLTLDIHNLVDLPIVSGINEKALKGEKIDERASQIASDIILKLSDFLESSRLQLELGKLENVSFLLDDLLRVRMGDAEGIARKMEVFVALLPVISGKWSQVEYVDVGCPDNPVIKYK